MQRRTSSPVLLILACSLFPRPIHAALRILETQEMLSQAHQRPSAHVKGGTRESECLTTRTGIEGQPFKNFWHVVAVTFPSFQLPHLRSFLFCIRSSCRLSSSNQPESLFGSKCGTDGMNRKHPFIPLGLWISISASISSRVYLVLARTLARNLVPSGWSAAPPNSQCL